MTAEAIAKVLGDLRARKVSNGLLLNEDPARRRGAEHMAQFMLANIGGAVVIDVSAIYDQNIESEKDIYLYEDHPSIVSPYDNLAVCYVNQHGNVQVMHGVLTEHHGDAPVWGTAETTIHPDGDVTDVPHVPDWDRVRWLFVALLWLGGTNSEGEPFPTIGPLHCFRFAIYEDGEPGDIGWLQLVDQYPVDRWDGAQLVLLGALNFLNASNVELIVPARQRAVARRLARTGVEVKTLSLFKAGHSSKSAGADGVGVPLTSVRGHWARYGPKYDRELLFGKIEGRFWVPAHARGEREHGEIVKDYKIEVPQ